MANTFDWDGFNEKAMNCEWCDGCIHNDEDDGMCSDCARCAFDYYETDKDRETEDSANDLLPQCERG